ncbi:MAG: Hpt domain-containing protein [Gemmatimonadota bacterium]|nr:Hpt domain-containing protein [Gemmatimonadota bacterium]
MTSPVGYLDFFVVEAGEYIERLDALLASAPPTGPDAEELRRAARSLRGTATMSRQYGISHVAAVVERSARTLREGTLPWDIGLAGALTGAVDDLRTLVRNARSWSAADERRVRARVAEFDRLVPGASGLSRRDTPPGGVASAFLATETESLAAALERLRGEAGAAAALGDALTRVRALRGVAGLKDSPALADVVDAVERAAKTVSLDANSPATAPRLAFFASAAAALRHIGTELAVGREVQRDAPVVREVVSAAALLSTATDDSVEIVPVGELFFGDNGPHIVSPAPQPPTTLSERFRMEVVGQAEYLARLVAEARAAQDHGGAERQTRELRQALRSLASLARSFGELDVARFAGSWAERAEPGDPGALAALDGAAIVLANPAIESHEVLRRLEQLTPSAMARVAPPPERGDVARPTRPASLTPSGQKLVDMLESGLAGFGQLDQRPLSAPVPLPDEDVVPIQTVLYAGRGALERALELRDQLRVLGGTPATETLDEIFALLDLAATG